MRRLRTVAIRLIPTAMLMAFLLIEAAPRLRT